MRTSIEFDPSYSLLTVELDPGESIKAETGAMVAQAGVDMKNRDGRRRVVRRDPQNDRRGVFLPEHLHR